MTKRQKTWLRSVSVAALSLACFGKVPVLSGKMIAYDPMQHAAKDASFKANNETVILEMPGPKKTRYVKVVFVGFGTSQIETQYFDGATPLTVQGIRDKRCDEPLPNLVSEVSLQERAGTYLLTDAVKSAPPKIKMLECYYATGKKLNPRPPEDQQ